MPTVAGVRLLGGLPARGPVARVSAVRDADGLPVRLVLVTASLDTPLRRRVQTESANLEDMLARLPAVLPLVDHGLDADGRPFLLAARPGPSLHEALSAEGPLSLSEVLAAAGAAAEGLRLLTGQGLTGPPPEVCRTGGGLVLSTPLPPALVELESALGDGTGHEPPEVLGGDDWALPAQTYACASMLWTLLAGRPPYAGQDRKLARLVGTPPPAFRRPGVPEPVIAVLRSALAFTPADRPADPDTLATALHEASRTPAPGLSGTPAPPEAGTPRHPTLPPSHPAPRPAGDLGAAAPRNPTIPPHRAGPAARPLGSRYELVSRIGGGAMGQVWAGRRREDDFPVAVKILRGELSEDPDTVDRFLRESRVLQGIRHPNVVEIYDFVKEGDVFGIVMELVDGEDLRHVAARGRLRPAEAAELLAHTASALAAVHAGGVVHRDVKPENILVTERDGRRTAFLSDFGISRGIAGSAHTRLLGTPAYLGPELWAGRAPTTATDVYALGITAYELLSGRLPFDAPSQEAMMRAHLEQSAPRPDGLDDTTWTLITACLDRDPARRPDAARVAAGWAALAGPHVRAGLTLPPASPPRTPAPLGPPGDPAERDPVTGTVISARPLPVRPAPPAPRPKRRLRIPLLTLLAVAVVGTGGGVVLANRHHASPPPKPHASASPKTAYYPVPASVVMSGAGATLTWGAQAGSLPGFRGYLVTDATARPLSPVLPKSAGSFAVHNLQSGRQACFLVIALVTSPPPGPVAQPACITPPRTGGTPTTRPKR